MSESESNNPQIVWHETSVSRQDRERLLGQKGCLIWFTGLSGCGKSTIANALDQLLVKQGANTFLLDGDNIRHGLCAPPNRLSEEHGESFAKRFGLGFGPEDREENIRRIGAIGQLFAAAGLVTLAAFVSPYRIDRDRVRKALEENGTNDFIEIFVDTPLEICEQRDPKGLYKQARAGKIPNFTGISDPYEAPENPEIHLKAGDGRTPQELATEIYDYLTNRGQLA
ncbi:Adenylyl-sulfate kinase [Roseimaritima multifibrata]|uniref:Adenylyl-sulfate kinase n=1 Tax=Roseimaritima multifibrata TaxID=1930274 RepID=A0A517MIS1_9BACT|nr:adenylyl-sulfate kinase [Roseimaritima multifibrata]QDS94792.1 Adenylyl-sulfate kinase [Roseimaritima multifibrata]